MRQIIIQFLKRIDPTCGEESRDEGEYGLCDEDPEDDETHAELETGFLLPGFVGVEHDFGVVARVYDDAGDPFGDAEVAPAQDHVVVVEGDGFVGDGGFAREGVDVGVGALVGDLDAGVVEVGGVLALEVGAEFVGYALVLQVCLPVQVLRLYVTVPLLLAALQHHNISRHHLILFDLHHIAQPQLLPLARSPPSIPHQHLALHPIQLLIRFLPLQIFEQILYR